MKTYRITVNGSQYDVTVEETGQGFAPAYPAPVAAPAPATAAPAPAAPSAPSAPAAPPKPSGVSGAIKVNSPLPGTIFKLMVRTGDTVTKGQVIVVIEAMKMENEIVAPEGGTVQSLNVSEGSSVNAGDLLLTMN